jgi:signal transduction histidine kinase
MSRARLALLVLVPSIVLAAGQVIARFAAHEPPAAVRARLEERAAAATRRFASFLEAARETAERARTGDPASSGDPLPARWRRRFEGAGRIRGGGYVAWTATPAEPASFAPGPERDARVVVSGMRTSLLVRTAADSDGSFGAASFALDLAEDEGPGLGESPARSAPGEPAVAWHWSPVAESGPLPSYEPGPPARFEAPLPGDRGEVLGRVAVEGGAGASRARGLLARARAWAAIAATLLGWLLLVRPPARMDARRAITVGAAILAARAALGAARTFEILLPRDAGSASVYGRAEPFGLLASPAALAATALAGFLLARLVVKLARDAALGRASAIVALAAAATAALSGATALTASLPGDVRMTVPRIDVSSPGAFLIAASIALALAAAAELVAALVVALGRRDGAKGTPGVAVVVALVPIAALALFGLESSSSRVVDERLRSEFAPLVMSQSSLRRLALTATVGEAAASPLSSALLGREAGTGDAFVAYRLWASGDLFHQGFVSSLDLFDAANQRRSHFGFGLPVLLGRREAATETSAGAAAIEIESIPVGASIERVLHAEAAVRSGDGAIAGVVIGHVLDDPSNLSFLPSNAPYLQALGRGPFPSEHRLDENPEYVLYDPEGRVVLSTLHQPPAPAPVLRAAAREGRLIRIDAGDTPYRVLPLLDDLTRLHLLLMPSPTALDVAADGVRLLLLGLAVVAILAIGTTVVEGRGGRALLVAFRGSFYRKLLAAVLVASVVPLVGLAVVLRGTIERRGEVSLAESASAVVDAAQRVVEDYQAVGEEDAGATPVRPTDETLSWLRRVVGQEIHLYEDGVLAATSKPELFDSGLLRKRLPGEVERAISREGQPYLVRQEVWGPVPLTVAYAPVNVRGGPRDAVVAVPLVTEQRERTRAVQRLVEMLLLGTTALVALLAGSAALLARSVADPVRRLALASRRIAEGDYATRLTSASTDEVGSLVADFNRMAQALADQRADLLRRRDYIEALLRHATTGVVSTDAAGRVVTINPAAASVLDAAGGGLSRGEPLLAALDRASGTRPLAEALAVDDGRSGSPIEVDLGPPDRLVRLRLVRVPLPDPAGGETGSLILLDDVTGLMRSNQLAAWAEMARAIAHEIKNPLTPIQLSTEHVRRLLADRGLLPSPEIEACLDTITRQVRELREISGAFSTYAKLPDLSLEPIDTASFLREVVAPYRAALPTGITIEEQDDGAPAILGDRRTLARALVNLIENALQAMPQGGVLRLASARDEAGGGALLTVQDTGPGLTAEVRARLFEPYFSTKSSGTGLGLAIVRRVVESHGGSIDVQSAPKHGTTFSIRLPAAARGPALYSAP